MLTDTARPRKYWNDLKRRLAEDEGFTELSANIGQLKMASADGKYYRTDAVDKETVLRIVQSVPSPKAEPIKRWLVRAGAERLDTITQPIDAARASTDIAVQAVIEPGHAAWLIRSNWKPSEWNTSDGKNYAVKITLPAPTSGA